MLHYTGVVYEYSDGGDITKAIKEAWGLARSRGVAPAATEDSEDAAGDADSATASGSIRPQPPGEGDDEVDDTDTGLPAFQARQHARPAASDDISTAANDGEDNEAPAAENTSSSSRSSKPTTSHFPTADFPLPARRGRPPKRQQPVPAAAPASSASSTEGGVAAGRAKRSTAGKLSASFSAAYVVGEDSSASFSSGAGVGVASTTNPIYSTGTPQPAADTAAANDSDSDDISESIDNLSLSGAASGRPVDGMAAAQALSPVHSETEGYDSDADFNLAESDEIDAEDDDAGFSRHGQPTQHANTDKQVRKNDEKLWKQLSARALDPND